MPPRLLTGALYLVGWVILAYVGGLPLTIAVALLSLVALLELRWVAGRRRMRLAVEVAYPIAVAFVFAADQFADQMEDYAVALLTLLTLLLVVDFALHLHRNLRSPTANVSLTVFATIYAGLMFSTIVLLRGYAPDLLAATGLGDDWPMGRRLLFFLLTVTMLSDVGAYVVGRTMGRHPLTETVSPKKTVEGCIGAVVTAVVAAIFAGQLFNVGAAPVAGAAPGGFDWVSLGHQVVMGLLLGVCGQIGDFGASILKREAEVKDYGSVFPGHGGVLDRFDTLLVNAPLLYVYVQLAL